MIVYGVRYGFDIQGYCHQAEKGAFVCKCSSGYTGDRCDVLDAVSLLSNDSYLAYEPWQTASDDANLTFTVTTDAEEGVIFYYGDDSHIAAELYQGHVKVSYYIGNYPVSLMYSYVKSTSRKIFKLKFIFCRFVTWLPDLFSVNDGVPHRLQFLPKGRVLTMHVDDNQERSIENRGKMTQLNLE